MNYKIIHKCDHSSRFAASRSKSYSVVLDLFYSFLFLLCCSLPIPLPPVSFHLSSAGTILKKKKTPH